ncbi:hypothetical protein SK128_013400 [Halocaridina rubra]|uniref:Uncharacterized protein n=1 Tax=Halocaridina rubra TaxID=373956 RepID=A0AAN9A3R6_HALRR
MSGVLFQVNLLLLCSCSMSAAFQGHQQLQPRQEHGNIAAEAKITTITESESHLTAEEALNYKGLGQYATIASETTEILPVISDIFDQLTPEAASLRSGDPFDSERLKNIIMAFIPATEKVLKATAKAQGKTVRNDVLKRLNALEKNLPEAFDIVGQLRKTDFHGIGESYSYYNPEAPGNKTPRDQTRKSSQIPAKNNPKYFSGSFVNMNNQRSFFINHPPKVLWNKD